MCKEDLSSVGLKTDYTLQSGEVLTSNWIAWSVYTGGLCEEEQKTSTWVHSSILSYHS